MDKNSQVTPEWPRLELVVVFGVVVLVIAGVILFGVRSTDVQRNAPDTQATGSSPAQSTAVTGIPSAEVSLTPVIEPTLPVGYPESPPPDLPPDKATAFALQPTELPESRPAVEVGIDNDMRQGPFSASEFVVRNTWTGVLGDDESDRWLLVYAGAAKDAVGGTGELVSAALRLYVMTANASGAFDLEYLGTFEARANTGALTIMAVTGEIMELRTDEGRELTFDLRTHDFQE